MSQQLRCDFCEAKIDESSETHYALKIDDKAPIDLCAICFESPIILSEQRRTRTRKPKAKVGRPKGSRTQKTTIPTNQESEKHDARNESARAAI